ncbi:MAG: hypothetical protein ABI835_09600, partial [Chloroflexota bacterium]
MNARLFAPSRLSLMLSVLLTLVLAFAVVSPAQAATIPAGCTGTPVTDGLALQTAVATANGTAAADIINLTMGCTYVLSSALNISAAGGALTIQTPAGTSAIIDGGAATRLIQVNVGANVTISRVVLYNGSTSGNGGAILNDGTLLINNNSVLSGNKATGAASLGGAIYSNGSLTMTDSTISSSSLTGGAGTRGGALYNSVGVTATLTNVAFNVNIANSVAGNGFGGAIYNLGTVNLDGSTFGTNQAAAGGAIYNAGALTITTSLFNGNSVLSPGGGGAIFNANTFSANVNRSTFSSNSAADGGALYNAGTLTLTNTTLYSNSVSSEGGGLYNAGGSSTLTNSTLVTNFAGLGGGIRNFSGTVTVNNTIVANSTSGGDCFGTLNATHSIIESGGCGVTYDTVPTLNRSVDPQIDVSSTTTGNQSYFPITSATSPAVNTGDDTLAPAGFDQAGGTRNQQGAVD